MSVEKVRKCDFCKNIIEKSSSYIWFPFYGFNGRIFCNTKCLYDWADRVSELKNVPTPDIQLS